MSVYLLKTWWLGNVERIIISITDGRIFKVELGLQDVNSFSQSVVFGQLHLHFVFRTHKAVLNNAESRQNTSCLS